MDDKIRKIFGEITKVNPYSGYLSDSTLSNVDEWIDTGSLALNAIVSGSMYKGIPVGRVTQFAGPSMTGKTFFVQKIIANAQKMGKYVAVFDSENAIDMEGAKAMGINVDEVHYTSTTTVENTRNAARNFMKKIIEDGMEGKFLIVIDSIAQMETDLGESRMEKDSGSADMGTFAKSVKSLMKALVNWSKLSKTAVVCTNEVYDDPSALYPSLEKNMPGGKAVAFKPSVTIQLARKPMKDDDGKTVDNTLTGGQKNFSGVVLRCLSVKNRFVKQYLEVELYLSFATGLDKFYGLLKIMKELGVVELEGKRYKDYKGNMLGFYKSWRKDKDVWKSLLPELERRIQTEWKYSNEEAPEEDDDDLLDAESEEPSKKKVSAKSKDKAEEEDKEADA